MTAIVTAVYGSETAISNVVEDLISVGIPRDRIATESSALQVAVTSAEAAEPEVTEILERHQPLQINSRHVA
jgi:hypothetical protein